MRVHGKTYIWLVLKLKLNAIENTKTFTLFDNGVFFIFLCIGRGANCISLNLWHVILGLTASI